MNLRRSCRLVIKEFTLTDLLDPSTCSLIIRDNNHAPIKEIPLSACRNFMFHIEAEDNLIINFTLQDSTQRSSAAGLLALFFNHLTPDQLCQLNCQLIDEHSHQQVGMLKIQLSFDDEKVTFNLQAKDSDNSDTEEWPQKSKLGPNNLTRISGKITRKRRHMYLIKDEHPRVVVNNKITSNKNYEVSNMMVKVDGRVVSIVMRDRKEKQFIGEVKCMNNPSWEELQQCSIKVPVQFNQIELEVKFSDKNMVFGCLYFSVITEENIKSVNIPLYDENQTYFGNLYLTYKPCTHLEQSNDQRLSLNTQILEQESKLIQPHLLKYLHNLHANSHHQKHTGSLIPQHHRLSINRSTLVSKTVDQKILPFNLPVQKHPSDRERSRTIEYEADPYQDIYAIKANKKHMKESPDRLSEIIRMRQRNQFLERDYQQYEEHQPSYLKMTPKSQTCEIRISSVLINLHSIYFIKQNISMERDVCVGKFLNLYSSYAHLFRSEQIFASQSLAWKLKNCHIQIKEVDTLTVELCLSKDKSVIGQSITTYHRLLASLNYNHYYKGQLISNNQEIGQIILNFNFTPLPHQLSPLLIGSREQARHKQKQGNKISKINQRLKLGLPHKKTAQYRGPRLRENDIQMGYYTPQKNQILQYASLQRIPEKQKRKRKFVFLRK